jgi:hypothetical protein
LADVQWMALPASPEIPRCFEVSDCFSQHLLKVQPDTNSQVRDFLPNHTIAGASDDHVICDASGSRVTNAFQRLMKRSKEAKSLTKEPR